MLVAITCLTSRSSECFTVVLYHVKNVSANQKKIRTGGIPHPVLILDTGCFRLLQYTFFFPEFFCSRMHRGYYTVGSSFD